MTRRNVRRHNSTSDFGPGKGAVRQICQIIVKRLDVDAGTKEQERLRIRKISRFQQPTTKDCRIGDVGGNNSRGGNRRPDPVATEEGRIARRPTAHPRRCQGSDRDVRGSDARADFRSGQRAVGQIVEIKVVRLHVLSDANANGGTSGGGGCRREKRPSQKRRVLNIGRDNLP